MLTDNVEQELLQLVTRCQNRESLADKLGVTIQARYQTGVRALFLGTSGTGKTLAASWLATRLGMPLYRVDLASVISKYIGETEANLAKLLAKAEQSEIVLLFDEADALFGKRTDIKDANDRFANSQTNYLLQRIETYRASSYSPATVVPVSIPGLAVDSIKWWSSHHPVRVNVASSGIATWVKSMSLVQSNAINWP